MFLDPLLAAPPLIQAHAFAAMAAFILGIVQFAGIKGALAHRILGWIWVVLMMFVAATSFWIREIRMWGEWSLIHLLGILVLVRVPLSVFAARRHKVQRHARAMTSLFIAALVIAGALAFTPGRVIMMCCSGHLLPDCRLRGAMANRTADYTPNAAAISS